MAYKSFICTNLETRIPFRISRLPYLNSSYAQCLVSDLVMQSLMGQCLLLRANGVGLSVTASRADHCGDHCDSTSIENLRIRTYRLKSCAPLRHTSMPNDGSLWETFVSEDGGESTADRRSILA